VSYLFYNHSSLMSTFIEKEGARDSVIFSVELATFNEILSLPSTFSWELK